jgi:hypothetical protein
VTSAPPSVGAASPRTGAKLTIERSAADSAKGPRLQRLRVALFILDAIAEPGVIHAYAAVEAQGDAFVSTATTTATVAYSEEDKNYDADGAFTFPSGAVLNSMVLFLDQWLDWRCSTKFRFGFYTTVAIGKEKNAGRVKNLKLTLPEKPLLELLHAHDCTDPHLLPCVTALILAEYEEQYGKSQSTGHLDTLRQWCDDDWRDFLGLISWLFSDADEAVAWDKLLKSVKACRYYTEQHDGREEIVASALVDLFDRKQLASDFAERFVHASEVDVLFRKVAAGELRATDPTWSAWHAVPSPTDQRNVGEKLTAACPTLSTSTLSRYQRRTAAGLAELDDHAQDKNVVAMRFQVYDVCENAVAALIDQARTFTEEQLDRELEVLTRLAVARVQQRSVEYGYTYMSESFVRGLVLELFDSCFLAFDRQSS